jgi:molybdate transport system substrate-binding protein
MKKLQHTLILGLILTFCAGQTLADEIRVAVASNFTDTIKDIAGLFEKKTGHQVALAFGSTGKHYAQIKNGAPFEAFFAADIRRPRLLEEAGFAQPGSRFTYAVGKVVLWSPDPAGVDAEGKVLSTGNFRHLALANPKLAPYGKAAEQVMRAHGVWDELQGRMVRGENIGQTFQFVKSGNAELGFVAYSQIKRPGAAIKGSFWEPPHLLYSPIEQQAVLLRDNTVAHEFLDFLKGEQAREIIQGYGYNAP